METERGTFLHLCPSFVPNLIASPMPTSMGQCLSGPKQSWSLSWQLLLKDALVMLNGWSITWKHLPFLLSQRCLWHFWDSFQLVLGQYKWNLNTLFCLFFSASFYYKLFPPNTFKGVVPKCMCELFVCQNWEKWWRIRNVLVLNMQYQQILQFNSTQKSETLCILAPVTLTVPPSGHSVSSHWWPVLKDSPWVEVRY